MAKFYIPDQVFTENQLILKPDIELDGVSYYKTYHENGATNYTYRLSVKEEEAIKLSQQYIEYLEKEGYSTEVNNDIVFVYLDGTLKLLLKTYKDTDLDVYFLMVSFKNST